MSSLLRLIEKEREKNSKTWCKIADCILDDPAKITSMKLKDFGNAAGVSEGSVVNFARSLGFDGYTDLKVGIAQANGRFSERYASAGSDTSILSNITEATKLSLTETATPRNNSVIAKVSRIISDTKGRVFIAGKSTSGYIASIFATYLMRLGIPAFSSSDAYISASSLRKGDVMIALSYSGATSEIYEAVNEAKKRDAYTVCISAFPKSIIAKSCDDTIEVISEESREGEFPIVARLIQLAVCDAVCSEVCILKSKKINKA